ncbi:MAG: HemK2/MTQ2 family protein methyltransferase [Promethearchaeia archaeon]
MLIKNIEPIINVADDDVYYPSDDSYLILDYFSKYIKSNRFDSIPFEQVDMILDLGTGSGIIAIYLALLEKRCDDFSPEIYASDISDEALKIAHSNACKNHVSPQIQFIKSDLFQSFSSELKNSFDIVIFNPPYLPSFYNVGGKSNKNLSEDRIWNGGPKGIEVILKFLDSAKKYITRDKKSYLYFISSSKADLRQLNRTLSDLGYMNQVIEKKHVFFEDIYLNRAFLQ